MSHGQRALWQQKTIVRTDPKDAGRARDAARFFRDTVQEVVGLKLFYKGENAASLGNAFVQQFMVKRRKALSPEDKQTLMERQQGKCDICGDRLQESAYEIDHIQPLCKGGADEIDNMRLLHPVCHSMATSQLRNGGGVHSRTLESQFSPETTRLFEE